MLKVIWKLSGNVILCFRNLSRIRILFPIKDIEGGTIIPLLMIFTIGYSLRLKLPWWREPLLSLELLRKEMNGTPTITDWIANSESFYQSWRRFTVLSLNWSANLAT